MILREYIFKETTTNTALFHHKFDRTAFHPSATDVYNANNANNGQMYPTSRDGHDEFPPLTDAIVSRNIAELVKNLESELRPLNGTVDQIRSDLIGLRADFQSELSKVNQRCLSA